MNHLLPLPRLAETRSESAEIAPGSTVSGPAPLTDAVRLALPVLDLRPGDAATAAVRMEEDPRLGPEAYALTIAGDGVRIAAGDRAGAFYAGQTLRQLLPAEAFRSALVPGTSWTVPCGRVEDAPEFSWRGAHLDVARSFLPKREVLRMIDLMALHKLNRLHLHLADDQGWRVESRAFPLLHEVGSHRPRTITSHKGEELAFDGVPHGGHYTLADLTEIAAYAGPGRSSSCPRSTCRGTPPPCWRPIPRWRPGRRSATRCWTGGASRRRSCPRFRRPSTS
ncbi:family 20 glycosylhydrolase [Microbispora sp. GKU 823]|uniref:family 20 glycosylhydrolase n=1 Tax=Microbispora sp. GKU 823 TaxID=1652100 RepID=UPI003569EF69